VGIPEENTGRIILKWIVKKQNGRKLDLCGAGEG
jgi:hypothetical protein